MTERKLPPVSQLAIASMAVIIVGGIYMAAHLPHHAPPALPTIALLVAAGLVAANIFLLARLRDFAWHSFFLVAKWSLVAYAVIAGMLEYVFVKDGTSGGTLVLVTLMLVVYAINVPLLFAFSVAQYQET
jgi:hypothetical protein